MAKITILFGFILIALGVIGYTGSTPAASPASKASGDADTGNAEPGPANSAGKKSPTALIPAAVGVLLAFFGVLALKESMLKHAMHGAATVGLLGALAGAGRGAMGLGKFFSGDPSLNQRSFMFVWLMAIICAVFVGLCVSSFVAARRRREAQESAT